MYKEILRSIAGIEVFPLISLCLFVTVFAVVVIRASRLDAARLDRFARLPLEADPASSARPDGDGGLL